MAVAMALHRTSINHICPIGLSGRTDPGRAVIVDIAFGDVQGHIPILEVTFNDNYIIGGDGVGLTVPAVLTNIPTL